MGLGGLDDRRHRLLDAQIDDVIAVVGDDDVDEVLADVVDVTLDRGEHQGALAGGVRLVHVRLEVSDCHLHDLRGLQHEGKLHLARPEEVANHLHAGQQILVHDVESSLGLHGLVEVILQALGIAVDDALLEALEQRHGGQLGLALGTHRGSRHSLEEFQEATERVITVMTPVVDEVEGDLALFLRNAIDRQDLRGVDDGRVQPGLDGLVEEDRVEDDAGCRVEAEGDVRDTEGGTHTRVTLLNLGDGVDGLQTVATGLLLTSADREGEAVDEDVTDAHAPVVDEIIDEARGHPYLPLGSACLALLVNGECDDSSPILDDHRHDALVARSRTVPVLEVHRVDDAATGQMLQTSSQDVGLGGVKDDWQRAGGGQSGAEFGHVRHAIATDVVDAQVEQVGAVAGLGPGDVNTLIPVLGQHRFTEGLGTVGVGALANGQIGGVLAQRDVVVQGGHGVDVVNLALGNRST